MRKCSHCKVEKPFSEFHKNKANKSGVTSYCMVCIKAKKAEHYLRHREKILLKNKENNKIDPEKARKRVKQWKLKNPEKVVQYRLNKYGITVAQKEAMIKKQNGCCAICNTKIQSQINTDHCHKTGKVREILCSPCNFLLGNCKDNINILQNAIEYLKKHQEN